MKATELRIAYSQVEPIPITEEWLLSFGFKKNTKGKNDYWYFNDDYRFHLSRVGALHCSVGNDAFGNLLCIKRYVHELQNFVFALSGEELKSV